MKNSIWIGKNKHGKYYGFTNGRPTIEDGELIGVWYSGVWIAGFFNLDLKPLEIVELIYDTETGNVEIKREREIGWYLVECKSVDDDGLIFACYWNGSGWVAVPNENKWRLGVKWEPISEGNVTVVSDKLPYNEYLKGLE